MDCLQIAKMPTKTIKMDSTDIALATGLLTMILDDKWIFLTFMLDEILELVDIGNKVLQSRGKQNVLAAVNVIESVKEKVKNLPSLYIDEKAIHEAVKRSMDVELQSENDDSSRKRKKFVPKQMSAFFVKRIVCHQLRQKRGSLGQFLLRWLIV